VSLISPSGVVLTSLIGVVPESVIFQDVEALISRQELPYVMYDPWKENNEEGRNVKGIRNPDGGGG